MPIWSMLEAGRPVGSPVTTGTPTAPTTTLATSGSLRPGGTVSTAVSATALMGPGINGPLLACCKVVIPTRARRTVASPAGSPIAGSPVTATVTAATTSAGGTTTGALLAALA